MNIGTNNPFHKSMTTIVILSLILLINGGRFVKYCKGQNCALIVPENPLSEKGLATPYILRALDPKNSPPCLMTNPNDQTFVEGVIFVPSTGQLFVYNPLVISENTQPAVAPIAVKLAKDAIVGLWFGTNAESLTLISSNNSLSQGKCVNGLGGSDVFGQFAACNAKEFFAAFKQNKKALVPPMVPLGTAVDGKPCMTVRDFGLVDMDQSDNVVTSYILTKDGKTAQNSATNTKSLGTKVASTLVNGSDNRLLAVTMAKVLNCKPYQAPDLSNGGALTAALALDEIQASLQQQPPVAYLPKGNPMVRIQPDKASLKKLNLYRAAVFQPQVPSLLFASTRIYCYHFGKIGPARIMLDKSLTITQASPNTDVATNLFTFLAQRFTNSWTGLKCDTLLDLPSPIVLKLDANGVTTDATLASVSKSDEDEGYGLVLEDNIDGYLMVNDTLLVDSSNSTKRAISSGENVRLNALILTLILGVMCLLI